VPPPFGKITGFDLPILRGDFYCNVTCFFYGRINVEIPPQPFLVERTEIPSSTSNKPERLN
jgi:hypothetical protein